MGLGIEDLDIILKKKRLRCYGHVERSNGAVKRAFDIQVDGKAQDDIEAADRGIAESGSSHDRHTWRSGMRSAMHAASQLPGRGCVCCSCKCMLIKKSDDPMMIH